MSVFVFYNHPVTLFTVSHEKQQAQMRYLFPLSCHLCGRKTRDGFNYQTESCTPHDRQIISDNNHVQVAQNMLRCSKPPVTGL